jgi:hypothetical protein
MIEEARMKLQEEEKIKVFVFKIGLDK